MYKHISVDSCEPSLSVPEIQYLHVGPLFVQLQVIKFLVPIWTMLFVFQPIEMVSDQEDLLPAVSEDGVSNNCNVQTQNTQPLYLRTVSSIATSQCASDINIM